MGLKGNRRSLGFAQDDRSGVGCFGGVMDRDPTLCGGARRMGRRAFAGWVYGLDSAYWPQVAPLLPWLSTPSEHWRTVAG